jgi:hypothetical protein
MSINFEYLNQIEGWLDPRAMIFSNYLKNYYLKDSFDSLEIGIHHGKFFLGLENITPKENIAFAIDVFDDQENNLDGSGKGNLEIFKEHIDKFAINKSRVKIIQQDSLQLKSSDYYDLNFGIISIDGGHTENHTLNDLQFAQDIMDKETFVILDDILNPEWGGVVTGFAKFNSYHATKLVPFAIGYNKLFMCHLSNLNNIQEKIFKDKEILNKFNLNPFKYTNFFSHNIITLK